ncbi:MAG: hypothetical protein ACLFS9_10090, partial [Nitriliruptoraceae bacterium]
MGRVTVPRLRPPRLLSASGWLRLLLGWRVVHIAAVAAAMWLALTGDLEGPGRIAGLAAAGVLLLLDVGALAGLLARRPIGRSLSLAADYLTFLGALLAVLQLTNVFRGLDALGATFVRGLPFGLLILGAWIVTGIGADEARFDGLRRVARVVIWIGVLGLLLRVGMVAGLAT